MSSRTSVRNDQRIFLEGPTNVPDLERSRALWRAVGGTQGLFMHLQLGQVHRKVQPVSKHAFDT
jgi:hypothetical protein